MTRKLVTIRQVREIKPIEGADKIEIALIDGWQCVVAKNDLKTDDLCVYFEIDSFLPVRPEFEFLRKSCYKKLADGSEGFRLRTIKLRGQLSQGLAMSLRTLPVLCNSKPDVGMDVTDLLGVVKYDPPLPASLSGKVKGYFPSFITKTDEERIQNLTDWFTNYTDVEFEQSEKLDGCSMTIFHNEGEIGVCSRNLNLLEDPGNTMWRIARENKIIEALQAFKTAVGQNIAIQGECIGEGINKNPYLLKGQHLYVFNIFNIDAQRYLTPPERFETLSQLEALGFKLKHVPVIGHVKVLKNSSVDNLLANTKGKSELNPKTEREGFVYKSDTLINGNIISFKVINNEYLLKEKD